MKEPVASFDDHFMLKGWIARCGAFLRRRSLWWALGFVFCVAAILMAASVHKRPQHNLTLCEAADLGDIGEVQWLLDHGASVNATDSDDTPLMFAAGRGHAEVAQYLVSRGADVNAGREHGRSALVQAICNHHAELAKWLITKGADVNVRDSYGDTVLHYAAHYGNPEVTQLLIAHGASPNALGDCGRTPLYTTLAYRAHSLRDISVAETLLKNGADPNIGATNDGAFGDARTPMQLAAFLKFPQLEELLLKYGAE